MKNISRKTVRSLLSYNYKNGIFIWKYRPKSMFKTEMSWKTWNTRFSGQCAGYKGKDGRVIIRIFGKTYQASRLAWIYTFGDTNLNVDHISGDASDNKILNLRAVPQKVNCKNQKIRELNKTGIIGVHWSNSRSKWVAGIKVDYILHSLGRYDDFFEACCARKSAERKYNFHLNHGRC